MNTNGWSFALATFRSDGSALGQALIDVDWEPARQWARHVALCEGRAAGGDDGATLEPLWNGKGEPFVRGFRVGLRFADAPEPTTSDFPNLYFTPDAQALSASYVKEGLLAAGDTFSYLPLALRDDTPRAHSRLGLTVTDVSPAPIANEKALGPSLAGATRIGAEVPGEIPVLVAGPVLDEVVAQTTASGSVEVGGVLVGHVHRDPSLRQVFVEVTAQILAQHTEATADRLLFTAETWRYFQDEIERRGQGEAMVSWWHSHPLHAWCDGVACEHEHPEACAAARDCFSEHDRAVHRVAFSAAHSIALVANAHSATDVTLSVFGWHGGMLVRRGLYRTA